MLLFMHFKQSISDVMPTSASVFHVLTYMEAEAVDCNALAEASLHLQNAKKALLDAKSSLLVPVIGSYRSLKGYGRT